MKKPLFTGAATALITPFDSLDRPDLGAFGRLLDSQLEAGIAGLVVGGTTGEGSTLQSRELELLLRYAVYRAGGAAPVIAGTGSNDTAAALARTRLAADAGAHGALVVTPYYNKTTQAGLRAHYTHLADRSPIPLILYEVPSRTGLSVTPDTLAALAAHPNIVGFKAASGDLSAMLDQMAAAPSLPLYSGSDDQTAALMALGARGVISVLSNLLPHEACSLCAACLRGDYPAAAALQKALLPLIRALFAQVNPVPVKAAAALRGLCGPDMRLPLVPLEGKPLQALAAVLEQY